MRDLQGEAEGLVQISWSLDVINHPTEPPCQRRRLVRGSSLRVVQVESRLWSEPTHRTQWRDRPLDAALSLPLTHTLLHITHTVSLTLDTLLRPPAGSSVFIIPRLRVRHHSASLPKHCRPLIQSPVFQAAATELFLLGFQSYQKTSITDFVDSEKKRLWSNIYLWL